MYFENLLIIAATLILCIVKLTSFQVSVFFRTKFMLLFMCVPFCLFAVIWVFKSELNN